MNYTIKKMCLYFTKERTTPSKKWLQSFTKSCLEEFQAPCFVKLPLMEDIIVGKAIKWTQLPL